MKTTTFFLFTIVLMGFISCCSRSDSVYVTNEADRSVLEPENSSVTFTDTLGNLSVIRYSTYDPEYGPYYETYPECNYRRDESVNQYAEVVSGNMPFVPRFVVSNNFLRLYMERDSLTQNDGDLLNWEPVHGNFTAAGVTYTSVRKYVKNDSLSQIEYILFNKEDKVLRLKLKTGERWDRLPG